MKISKRNKNEKIYDDTVFEIEKNIINHVH